MLLRDENFDSAKILPVAHQHDLAAHIDLQFVEFLEVVRRPVVGVDHIGFDVARGRHAVEGHDHARIVLIRIVVDVLARGTVHLDSGRRGQIDADFGGIVHPDFVLDDLGVEPGVAEFLRDVVGGRLVFDSARHVRSLGQNAQMLFRELGIGHRQKARFGRLLGGRVAKTKDGGAESKTKHYRLRLETIPRAIGLKKEWRLREVSWAPAVKVSKVAQALDLRRPALF